MNTKAIANIFLILCEIYLVKCEIESKNGTNDSKFEQNQQKSHNNNVEKQKAILPKYFKYTTSKPKEMDNLNTTREKSMPQIHDTSKDKESPSLLNNSTNNDNNLERKYIQNNNKLGLTENNSLQERPKEENAVKESQSFQIIKENHNRRRIHSKSQKKIIRTLDFDTNDLEKNQKIDIDKKDMSHKKKHHHHNKNKPVRTTISSIATKNDSIDAMISKLPHHFKHKTKLDKGKIRKHDLLKKQKSELSSDKNDKENSKLKHNKTYLKPKSTEKHNVRQKFGNNTSNKNKNNQKLDEIHKKSSRKKHIKSELHEEKIKKVSQEKTNLNEGHKNHSNDTKSKNHKILRENEQSHKENVAKKSKDESSLKKIQKHSKEKHDIIETLNRHGKDKQSHKKYHKKHSSSKHDHQETDKKFIKKTNENHSGKTKSHEENLKKHNEKKHSHKSTHMTRTKDKQIPKDKIEKSIEKENSLKETHKKHSQNKNTIRDNHKREKKQEESYVENYKKQNEDKEKPKETHKKNNESEQNFKEIHQKHYDDKINHKKYNKKLSKTEIHKKDSENKQSHIEDQLREGKDDQTHIEHHKKHSHKKSDSGDQEKINIKPHLENNRFTKYSHGKHKEKADQIKHPHIEDQLKEGKDNETHIEHHKKHRHKKSDSGDQEKVNIKPHLGNNRFTKYSHGKHKEKADQIKHPHIEDQLKEGKDNQTHIEHHKKHRHKKSDSGDQEKVNIKPHLGNNRFTKYSHGKHKEKADQIKHPHIEDQLKEGKDNQTHIEHHKKHSHKKSDSGDQEKINIKPHLGNNRFTKYSHGKHKEKAHQIKHPHISRHKSTQTTTGSEIDKKDSINFKDITSDLPQHDKQKKVQRISNILRIKNAEEKTGTKKKQSTQHLDRYLSAYNLIRHLENLTELFHCANITQEIIGRTVGYNNIILLKITEKWSSLDAYFRADKYVDEAPKKQIVFIVHGLTAMGIDKLDSISYSDDFMELLEKYMAHLKYFDIFLIPIANPDGLDKARQTVYWNKNNSPGSSCSGVALDRNFDVKWQERKKSNPCSQHYPGPSPLSEIETQAVSSVLHRYSHKMYAYIHVHAGTYNAKHFKGDAVLYPRGYTDLQSDDDKYMDLKGEIDEELKEAGFRVMSVAVESLFNWYGKVTGTSVDYAATIYGIPFAMEFAMQLYSTNEEQELAQREIWHRVVDITFGFMYNKTQETEMNSQNNGLKVYWAPVPELRPKHIYMRYKAPTQKSAGRAMLDFKYKQKNASLGHVLFGYNELIDRLSSIRGYKLGRLQRATRTFPSEARSQYLESIRLFRDRELERQRWPKVRHRLFDPRYTRRVPMFLMLQEESHFGSKEHGEEFKEKKSPEVFDSYFSPYSIRRHLKQLISHIKDANITLQVIGRTVSYNDIVLLKISEGTNKQSITKVCLRNGQRPYDDDKEKKIIFIVHGLSVMGYRQLPCLSEEKKFLTLLEIYMQHLDKFDIFVVPMANPDGVAVSMQQHWNKNASPQSACSGVALDRNFEVEWTKSDYTSCSQKYPGPYAFSENETRAISDVLHAHATKIAAYIHVHAGSYSTDVFKGDAVLYPRGYTEWTSDDDKYLDIKGEIDEAIKSANFQVLSVAMDTLYNWYGRVHGTSVDFAAVIYGIPYALEFVMQLYSNDMFTEDSDEKETNVALEEVWGRVINATFTSIYKGLHTNENVEH